jgi:formylglycine-generating enzyme required for sulfatase activity
MSHIFISYSKQNIAFARRLRHLLEAEGFAVWMDETRLVPSERWWPTIEKNIRTCAAFIVIMSPEAQTSDWVEREILLAERTKKLIFPVLLDGEAWARLGNIQYDDMTAGMKAVLSERFINGLALYAPQHTGEAAPPPLPGEPLTTAVQPPLPVRVESPPRPPAAPVWRAALIIVLLLVGGLLGLSALNSGALQPSTPTAAIAPTTAIAAAISPTLDVQAAIEGTQTAIVVQTAAALPTVTPTATEDFAATVQAGLDATATAFAEATLAATLLTPLPTSTPTPDPLQAAYAQAAAYDYRSGNAAWTPIVQDFDGVPMMLVPPGCFMMGSNDGDDDEQPAHEQCFDAPFWMDQTEVTQADFARLGGRKANANGFDGDQRPVERITWFEARDFCVLRGMRLPTEREWEYAARGPDALVYPWGNTWTESNAVWSRNSNSQTANVGSRPAGASWTGALDMAGNVWEWTSSLYGDYPYVAAREDENNSSNARVVRGGSFDNSMNDLRAANRYDVIGGDNSIGFRCARLP